MNIFETPAKKVRRTLGLFFPAALLAAACLVFAAGVSRTSAETLAQEQKTLTSALEKGAVHTYALTGAYPESLEQLLEDYTITYDHNKFVVEYVPNGSNLLPAINVIPLEKGGSS